MHADAEENGYAASIAQMGCGERYGPLPATGESVSFTSPALSCSEPMPQPTNGVVHGRSVEAL
jgi:hypothetical protein